MGLLLVQGGDDQAAISVILERNAVQPVTVKPLGGLEPLLEVVSVQARASAPLAWGVVVDAGRDLAGRWDRLCAALAKGGYGGLPGAPDPRGTVVVEAYLPKVGIWVMPDNVHEGTFEDFLKSLVPLDDMVMRRAEATVAALFDEGAVAFEGSDIPKAVVLTWLAWQKSPGASVRTALNSPFNRMDARAEPALAFVDWARRLFS